MDKIENKLKEDGLALCILECVVMANGEIISMGKHIGWLKDFGKFVSLKEKEIAK